MPDGETSPSLYSKKADQRETDLLESPEEKAAAKSKEDRAARFSQSLAADRPSRGSGTLTRPSELKRTPSTLKDGPGRARVGKETISPTKEDVIIKKGDEGSCVVS